ncbi:MAG: SpoIID/LytB domain-containing protein [Bacteroidaceae bacterium]|nr:SpoIID/LytB domain-containing protein [Bacteroidaceae bacterium]
MRKVDIGILRAPQIKFDFIGAFCFEFGNGKTENIVFIEDGKLSYEGGSYDEILFTPCGDDSMFTLHDVVIGVNFHWQRKESQSFKGELRLIVEDGEVRAINRIDVEEYLVSVISSEMSATSSLEFLKAHTIVSRSWLYAQLLRKERIQQGVLGWENQEEIIRWYAREDHTLFDLCADDHCQRYQGVTRAHNPNVERAVKETSGIVLEYDGEVCDARFSKCCGGVTERFSACWENEDYAYLQAFRDAEGNEELPDLSTEEGARDWIEKTPASYCSTTDNHVLSQILNGYDRETNDFYRWRVEYSQKELSRLIAERSGIDFGTIEELLPVERGASGRIVKLKVVGSKTFKTVGKELEIRRWLSKSHLYSSAFVVDKSTSPDGEVRFVLKGAGWGHGVGLCQIGAAMMGEKGCSCEQILSFYYPGCVMECRV